MRQKIVYDMYPSRVNVGISAFVGLTAVPGQLAVSLQYISGGTLEINNPFSGGAIGTGFPLVAGTVFSFECAGTMYLSSQSATSIVSVLWGRAQGFEGASLGFKG